MPAVTSRVLSVFAGLGLLFAGCGSSGSSKPNAVVTTTTAVGISSDAPNTQEQRAADKALAKRAVLNLADLPAGYESTPPSDSDSEVPPAALAQFA